VITVRENHGSLSHKENKMLDSQKMGKQMLEFYQTTLNNSFSTMMMLQEQMERMANLFWGQMVAIPEEAKKDLAEWTKSYKKNCEYVKKVWEEGFKNLESLAT
jgi:hypothetical protein